MTSLEIQIDALHSKFVASTSAHQRLAYLEAAFIAVDAAPANDVLSFERQLSSKDMDDDTEHMRHVVTSMCVATCHNGVYTFLREEPYGRWKNAAATKAGFNKWPNPPDVTLMVVKRPAQKFNGEMADDELPPIA